MNPLFPQTQTGQTWNRLPIKSCLLGLLLAAAPAFGQDLIHSKHNLSADGPGLLRAATESQVCIFCHTPHNAVNQAPLWNRYSSGASYIPYNSSTTKAVIGQPTGSSKLCLSCHDGTVALGMVRSRDTPISFQGGITTLSSGKAGLATDLTDDHPISFAYDPALAAANGQLHHPATLTDPIRLEDGQLQCTSCHEPHSDQYGMFLVQDNTGSALCISCHDQRSWAASAHATSLATWNGAGLDPWPHTEHVTVADNACGNCHRPHSAGSEKRLLNFQGEEQNCYPCHNGNVAQHDLQSEFKKFSTHPIETTSGVHDPTEDLVNAPRHVECVDCHNPHAANTVQSDPRQAAGSLTGISGVDISGNPLNPIQHEYELCLRCHADSVRRGRSSVTRQFVQVNTRLEFDPANTSYHPVVSISKNLESPSLKSAYTSTSLISCTDCHNNNQGPEAGGSGPRGPHGSAYQPILERQQLLTDYSPESSAIYALCYKCHSRQSILSDQNRGLHYTHVVKAQTACTTCHDPHGVENMSHLINFNVYYVTPPSDGSDIRYVNEGPGRGACYLTCHQVDHSNLEPKKYPMDTSTTSRP